MKIEEMNDIIFNDPIFLDIFKWEKKHFKAYDLYLKFYGGIPRFYRARLLKKIKRIIKHNKKGVLNNGKNN